ncbi:tryptophan halogenase family protein [Cognaticolwellia beringensis]|uniref:Tryptophan 7-halogenase n=1 Tax=Cognaticolwellia beringensis TaxID=1967665 RepID=A0A222GAD5_9GAMM|nr:tryptophan halogenase family protein [Cognaticolwellia beringensis]ASP48845.1 tryptophan 7-halogenase [Cognaticolwellia beringensis]
MTKSLKHVVIVGGGSAGWITAGTIAAMHNSQSPQGIQVTLIESPDVNIIGVGEGTWPTMRTTLKKMGISETDFMRQCDVSFKQGAKFSKWVTGEEDDFYYHPLVLPEGYFDLDLFNYWQKNYKDKSFSDAVCFQEQLCEKGLAPKLITSPEYAAVANYAYHLDAGKFANFLKQHCISTLGVNYISDHVEDIINTENNDILAVTTKEHGNIEGDLFVDCTGFKSLLIGQHYQVPFISKKDILFIDTALAVQIPYEEGKDDIASHTISTAQDSGWIWDIGLPSRRGVGHVYSSRHTNQEAAEKALRAYLRQSIGDKSDTLTFRKIDINPGVRETFWVNNCVAVGLSAGFLEPLEASALVMIELAATAISEQLPANRATMDIVAKRFNERFSYNWDRIIDFLKLHYVASKREDSAFWRDNRDKDTIPESLQELLSLWRYRAPSEYDFSHKREVFSAASYQYVLYGMAFDFTTPVCKTNEKHEQLAQRLFAANENKIEKYTTALPTNRELISKINQYGFSKI